GGGAAVVPADRAGAVRGLAPARRDRADADLGHQLDADPRPRVRVLQVMDQLRQVFDRVDIVVRRRADQADAGRRVPDLGDPGPDLVTGELPPLAGLGPLRHLDLELVGAAEVLASDA